MAAEVFQQGDSPDVEEVGERCDRQESENQFVVFVLEDENPVSFEIEENADDGGDEVGDDVCVIELEQMREDKEKQIIDETVLNNAKDTFLKKEDIVSLMDEQSQNKIKRTKRTLKVK